MNVAARVDDLARSFDLALHRLRVGHGVPEALSVGARWVVEATRNGYEQREARRVVAEAEAVKAAFAERPLSLRVSRLSGDSATRGLVPIGGSAVLDGLTCVAEDVTPDALSAAVGHMRHHGRRALQAMPVTRILRLLDRASRLWLDPAFPLRSLAIEAIHRRTGFSREMVIHSIDLEMRSSRLVDLWRTLWTELGNPRTLDARSWAPAGEAPVRAFGPSVIAAVFSSNIPALPHLSYMRGLAVKSPVLGKVSTHEPIFASLYVDTLVELCPELAPALGAVWFSGEDESLARALVADAELVIAYGGDAALDAIGRMLPRTARSILHGHRMGIGLVDGSHLARVRADDALARAIAYDFAAFDGQACLAPVVYFVEGRLQAGVALARRIGRALDDLATWLPPRVLTAPDRAARASTIASWEVTASFAEDAAQVVRSETPRGWAGLVTTGRFAPQRLGDRLFHLHCVERLEDAVHALTPFARHLQNVAVAAEPPRRASLAASLAELGASRSTEPGRMPTPSMMWHHDGRSCLADLVRWSDLG